MSGRFLPKLLRFAGRVFLSMGAILAVGMVAMLLYSAVQPAAGPAGEATSPPVMVVDPQGGPAQPNRVQTSQVIWLGILLVLFGVGLALTFKRLNVFVRDMVVKIARFLGMEIFLTELALGFVVWDISIIVLLFVLPVGAIMSGAFLILTELSFALAWLLYKRPKYPR